MKLNTLFILSLFFVSSTLLGQIELNQQKITQPIPIDPDVRIGTLSNGIRYYIRKNQKPEDRAELRLVLKAGAMQEDDDQKGLAHFVEHMAFNGTKNFEKNELVDYLESVGMRFGPDLNAYTSFDETVYMLQARTDSMEYLNKGLLILQDWASGLTFDSTEIDKERGVVESERRSSLSPDQRMMYKYLPIVYKGSRYTERLPIGTSEVINNADYATVKRFYTDWYRPDLMAIVAVGDFDIEAMETKIKKQFSTIIKVNNPRPLIAHGVPMHKETRIAVIGDPEASFTRVQLQYKHPRVSNQSQTDFRQSLVHSIYNRMLSSRLDELSKKATPPFTFGYSGYSRDFGNIDAYEGYAFTAEGGALLGLQTLLEENKRVLLHGFSLSELERQKTELLKRMERGVKEKDKTESRNFASSYVYNFLNNNPIPSIDQRLTLYQKYLPTITLTEVNQLAQKWITDENRVVIITGPEKEETTLPTESEVREVLTAVEKTNLIPYVDQVSDAPLLDKKLAPTTIASEKQLEAIDATEIILANGVKIILKKTDFKNDQIIFDAFSPGGHSLYPDSDYQSASAATTIIRESGISEFSNIELEKKLVGKKVGVSPYIGEMFEGISGGASPEDLETMFKLIYLSFTAPRADSIAFQSHLAKQKSIFANLMSNPQYYFIDQATRTKFGDNPRRIWPTAEELDALDFARVHAIYKDRFADASDFTFVFVGNFEIEMMKKMVAIYLGNLPTLEREETYKDLNIDLKTGKIINEFQRGEAPKALVELTWHGDDFDLDAENMTIFNTLIGVLKIKMRESMREDKGGVYGVSVSGNPRRYPDPAYSIVVSFNSEPEKVEELITTALADIADVKTNGATEKNLQKVKETSIQGRTKALKENSFWLSSIKNHYRAGKKDFKYVDLENYSELINSVTTEQVQQAANQYFNEDNFIKIIMKPI